MIYVILVAAIMFFVDYMPAYHGDIKNNKRDFTVFLIFALVAIVALVFYVYDLPLPNIMGYIESLFKDIGLHYN